MGRPDRLDERIDRVEIEQVGAVSARAIGRQPARRSRAGPLRQHGMHFVARCEQRIKARVADEPARPAYQYAALAVKGAPLRRAVDTPRRARR